MIAQGCCCARAYVIDALPAQFAVANSFGCPSLGEEICFPAHEVVCANSACII